MRDEIVAAVSFLMRLVEKNKTLTIEKLKQFETRLVDLLMDKFKNHWFPEKPTKGQAYRCIRFNENDRRDKTLEIACKTAGLKFDDLKLPVELTLWVDPEEVTCRFGEHKGSYCIVASFKDGNKENNIDTINIDELEQKSLERAKQASFDMVNSRKKQLKNYHNNKMTSNISNALEYTNGGGVLTSSPSFYHVSHSPYYGSPKFTPHYSSSPPTNNNSNNTRHNSVQPPPASLALTTFPMSPTNSRNYYRAGPPANAFTLTGAPTNVTSAAGPHQPAPPVTTINGNNVSNANNNNVNSVSSFITGNKFSRGLHSAFNNAAAVSYSLGQYQPSDRYHWINKPIVKA